MPLVGRRDYFDAAMGRLASVGFDGLTIAALCEDVGVTSGSFYHHFGSWDGFVAALVDDWREQQTARIIELTERTGSDSTAQFDHLLRLAKEVPHRAESAIRAWAGNNLVVAEGQRRVDRERLTFVEQLLTPLLQDAGRARTLAAMVLATFVGLQLIQVDLGDGEFDAVLDGLRELVLAGAPATGRSARSGPAA